MHERISLYLERGERILSPYKKGGILITRQEKKRRLFKSKGEALQPGEKGFNIPYKKG